MKNTRNTEFSVSDTRTRPEYGWLLLVCLMLYCVEAHAHGGVFLEDDLCVIQIGFYRAHFTIYQPRTSRHEEFCEDIPHTGESVFVMEYLHDSLRELPVEFRIIRDVQNRGRFVKQEDINQIDDLDQHTVFYQPPSVQPYGVFLALHQFKEEGNYIGIVTTENSGGDSIYTAVFPFRVGDRDWGYIPLFITLAVLLQLNYWLINGGYARIYKKLKS